ncbi:MAG TPA: ABC transporter ATP-binding protein [Steroidobacteraceae bacterium]|nr:ABC transporter ATP-binding protein [Steroidobacteraceae bacterium]
MAASVSLRGVSRRYVHGADCVDALREVHLEIAAGAFVAVLGPSGAGKTTLLDIVAGLDTPHAGAVLVDGEDVAALGSRERAAWRARHVGLVFSVDHLVPLLTIQRNVEIPLLGMALSRHERRRDALAALDEVGLTHRAHCMPAQLSLGERRRVTIARALVTRPTLLVCDEPTKNLGRDSADAVLATLQVLSTRATTTIVMSTEDPAAAAWASHVVALEGGHASPVPRAQAAA